MRDPTLPEVFEHPGLGSAHVRHWTCRDPELTLLFVPGNPGLVDFYIQFLDALVVASSKRISILAHAHLGHTPGIPATHCSLESQVASAIEAFDKLNEKHDKVGIIAHSVGTWITLQILKARPDAVHAVFLIHPTISNLALTRNGKALSKFFRPPVPYLLSTVSHLFRLLPTSLLHTLFLNWPKHQVLVLQTLLHSPSSIFNCLSMAHEEMRTIVEPDIGLLDRHSQKITLYYGTKDDWVNDQKERVLSAVNGITVFHGTEPHSFCINHSDQLAAQCAEWLRTSP